MAAPRRAPRRVPRGAVVRGAQMLGPLLPPQARKTYGIRRPAATHSRPATCAEVGCTAWLHGWRTTVDEQTDLGRAQAAWIRGASGRRYDEARTEAGLTAFTFGPEQPCFAAGGHRIEFERPPLFVVRGGDARGNPLRIPPRVHRSAEDWRDDFGEHQEKLADRLRQG